MSIHTGWYLEAANTSFLDDVFERADASEVPGEMTARDSIDSLYFTEDDMRQLAEGFPEQASYAASMPISDGWVAQHALNEAARLEEGIHNAGPIVTPRLLRSYVNHARDNGRALYDSAESIRQAVRMSPELHSFLTEQGGWNSEITYETAQEARALVNATRLFAQICEGKAIATTEYQAGAVDTSQAKLTPGLKKIIHQIELKDAELDQAIVQDTDQREPAEPEVLASDVVDLHRRLKPNRHSVAAKLGNILTTHDAAADGLNELFSQLKPAIAAIEDPERKPDASNRAEVLLRKMRRHDRQTYDQLKTALENMNEDI